MYHFISITLILFTALSTSTNNELSSSLDDSGCPLWTYRHEFDPDPKCRCGTTLNGKVQCNMNTSTLTLLHNLCMTYNLATNKTFVGYCPYSAISNIRHSIYQLPMQQKDNITSISCSTWRREGTLCSECRHNYGVPLYSYYLECAMIFE